MNNLDNVIKLLNDLSLSELEDVRESLDQLIGVCNGLTDKPVPFVVWWPEVKKIISSGDPYGGSTLLEALDIWADTSLSNNGWGVDCLPTDLKIMLDDCLGLPILVTKDCLKYLLMD